MLIVLWKNRSHFFCITLPGKAVLSMHSSEWNACCVLSSVSLQAHSRGLKSYLLQCPLYFQARNKMLNYIRQLSTFHISGDLLLYAGSWTRLYLFVCLFILHQSCLTIIAGTANCPILGGLGSSLHLLWRELGSLACLRVTLPRTRNLHL